MFDPDELPELKETVFLRTRQDQQRLDELRKEVRALKDSVQIIRPRNVTAASLVGSDGGNISLIFDPFHIHLVRVVDSKGKRQLLDAVSILTDTDVLSRRLLDDPDSPLGLMMRDLGVRSLNDLSYMIPSGREMRERPESISSSWMDVYRDMCEWAVLYKCIRYRTFGSITLMVRDGLLRSISFREGLFPRLRKMIEEAITEQSEQEKLRMFLVGIAKKSKLLSKYQLAMSIENIFPEGEPRFVRIPRAMEFKAYNWPHYAVGPEVETAAEEAAAQRVAGDMYFVRFGSRQGDPVWAVDILSSQSKNAQEVFGLMLEDARCGFPVPYYPLCLQKAHEYARIEGLDLSILQDFMVDAMRELLPTDKQDVIERMLLNEYREERQ